MPLTVRQQRGVLGELAVTRLPCPRCKRPRTLRRLPPNFKCADVICDFCGYLAQVKTTQQESVDKCPASVMGSAWQPQAERMGAGIYFPLFIVVVSKDRKRHAVYYLPPDLQARDLPEAPPSVDLGTPSGVDWLPTEAQSAGATLPYPSPVVGSAWLSSPLRGRWMALSRVTPRPTVPPSSTAAKTSHPSKPTERPRRPRVTDAASYCVSRVPFANPGPVVQ